MGAKCRPARMRATREPQPEEPMPMTDSLLTAQRPEPGLDRPRDDRPVPGHRPHHRDRRGRDRRAAGTRASKARCSPIHQSDATLDAMDAWNKGTHGRSGLIDRVKASTFDEATAEAQVIEFLQALRAGGQVARCAATASARTGASWPTHMPALEAFFHYRNLDVSTLKELARRWKPDDPGRLQEGAGAHRAGRHPRVDRRAGLLPRALPRQVTALGRAKTGCAPCAATPGSTANRSSGSRAKRPAGRRRPAMRRCRPTTTPSAAWRDRGSCASIDCM